MYGTVGTTRSNSTYVLDGSPPVSFVAPKPPSPVYREAFFSSSVLSAGLHTLNVTAMGEGSYFWLDYLQYTSTYDGQETEPTPSPASPSSSVNPSAEAPRRSIPTGAICGIVIGGVCVVLVAVFTLLYLRGWICSTTRVKQRPQNEDLDIALEGLLLHLLMIWVRDVILTLLCQICTKFRRITISCRNSGSCTDYPLLAIHVLHPLSLPRKAPNHRQCSHLSY